MQPDKSAAVGRKPSTADEPLRSIRDTIDRVDVARKALLADQRDAGATLIVPAASRRRRRGRQPR